MKEIVNKALSGKILDNQDISEIINGINNETMAPEQIAAILGALAVRGVKDCEISNFAKNLKKFSKPIPLKGSHFMDVCGTGGDCLNTFNISTAVGFIAAAAGAKIVKHGARSVSSSCGSADVLEELGISIDLDDNKIQKMFDEENWVFLYAPNYNKTMACIKKIRNAIQAPTLFNLMGPLIHPLNLEYQVMGVYCEKYAEVLANTLNLLGLKHAAVIHGAQGIDELSLKDGNIIYEVKNNKVSKFILPSIKELGLIKGGIEDIKGGDKKLNAQIILNILKGEKGAKRDIVVLNAALCLYISDIVKDIKEGISLAQNTIDNGNALKLLERLKNVSR